MHRKNALCAMLFCVLGGCVHFPPIADMRAGVSAAPPAAAATMPFLFDDNRVFVEIAFIRPDGSRREALAFVNMGAGAFVLSNKLFRELAPKPGTPLHIAFGTLDIALDGAAVQPESIANSLTIGLDPFAGPPDMAKAAQGEGGMMAGFAAPLPVEAEIPPGLLQHFVVTYDYAARTMTLAPPGAPAPEGIAVPLRIAPHSGVAVVDVVSDGTRHPFVLDNGGSWGLVRDAGVWTKPHPDWLRGVGGIGEANYLMDGQDADVPVLVLRDVHVGPLTLAHVGVAQTAGDGLLAGWISGLFWDRIYAPKAGEPVEGAIGGDVLRHFKLSIDYPRRMSYWQEQSPLDGGDLDQVGIVLGRRNGETRIAAVARKDGSETVTGVQPDDKLLKIGDLDTATATRGQLLGALHGRPGESKRLLLERDGKQFTVDVSITAF
ncbi:MAG: hypothetical protein WDM91_00695 [Rhizomicrobium sp.]